MNFILSGSQSMAKAVYIRHNGTSSGTFLVKDFTGIPVKVNRMLATDSLIYFHLYNRATNTNELWRSDGTDVNTYVIKSGFSSYNGELLILQVITYILYFRMIKLFGNLMGR